MWLHTTHDLSLLFGSFLQSLKGMYPPFSGWVGVLVVGPLLPPKHAVQDHRKPCNAAEYYVSDDVLVLLGSTHS